MKATHGGKQHKTKPGATDAIPDVTDGLRVSMAQQPLNELTITAKTTLVSMLSEYIEAASNASDGESTMADADEMIKQITRNLDESTRQTRLLKSQLSYASPTPPVNPVMVKRNALLRQFTKEGRSLADLLDYLDERDRKERGT